MREKHNVLGYNNHLQRLVSAPCWLGGSRDRRWMANRPEWEARTVASEPGWPKPSGSSISGYICKRLQKLSFETVEFTYYNEIQWLTVALASTVVVDWWLWRWWSDGFGCGGGLVASAVVKTSGFEVVDTGQVLAYNFNGGGRLLALAVVEWWLRRWGRTGGFSGGGRWTGVVYGGGVVVPLAVVEDWKMKRQMKKCEGAAAVWWKGKEGSEGRGWWKAVEWWWKAVAGRRRKRWCHGRRKRVVVTTAVVWR
nr:hypothetical protein Iba_chr15cCG8000 [Ipomoea batatas]